MESLVIKLFFALFEIFIFFALGATARKLNLIKEESLTELSKICIYFFFPFLVFRYIVIHFDAEKAHELIVLPSIGLGCIIVGTLVGWFLKNGMKTNDSDIKKTFHHLCAINNYGFMPIIILRNLWGETYVAKLLIINVGSTIGYWVIGVALLGESNLKKQIKNIISPSLITVMIAISICLSGQQNNIPDFVLKASIPLGEASIAVMLFIIGASLVPLPKFDGLFDLGYFIVARHFIIPILLLLILMIIPLEEENYKICIIISLMPAAFTSAVLTRVYGGSTTYALKAVILSTLFCLISIPLTLYLLDTFHIISFIK